MIDGGARNVMLGEVGGRQRQCGSATGHVRTWAGHDAVVAAWMAEGVMDVTDELYVSG